MIGRRARPKLEAGLLGTGRWSVSRKLVKEDRDKNFIAKNKDGLTVNRWVSTGFLAASATTNETAFLTYKVVQEPGHSSPSTIKQEFDTAQRWPVWPQLSAVAR